LYADQLALLKYFGLSRGVAHRARNVGIYTGETCAVAQAREFKGEKVTAAYDIN
jgi:hypothetical protein